MSTCVSGRPSSPASSALLSTTTKGTPARRISRTMREPTRPAPQMM
jgi:hypothetical protein